MAEHRRTRPLMNKLLPAHPVKAAVPNPKQIMLSSTTEHLYLRFPFDAAIVRFINEQMADSTYNRRQYRLRSTPRWPQPLPHELKPYGRVRDNHTLRTVNQSRLITAAKRI
jgi:hypothetical protein